MNDLTEKVPFRPRPAEGRNFANQATTGCGVAGLQAGEQTNEAYQEAVRRQRSVMLDELFSYHAPTPEQLPRYRAIRSAARHFAEIILDNAPACNDQNRAIDAVRDAMMLANAAIATNGRA